MQSSTRSIMPAMQVSCIDVACTLGAWQVLCENGRVSPVQEATCDGEGPEELLLTIGRRPRELMSASGHFRRIGVLPTLAACPLRSERWGNRPTSLWIAEN